MGDGKRRLQPIMWASILSVLAAFIAGERHGPSLYKLLYDCSCKARSDDGQLLAYMTLSTLQVVLVLRA